MKILSIETSCEQGSVALLTDDALVARRLEGSASHSEGILVVIRELLAEAGIVAGALDAVAFGSGPGAFTGLRLACGVAQGLALGAGLGIAPVSSLAALALQARERRVFAATDARMGEIYCEAFVAGGGGFPVSAGKPLCCAPDAASPPEGIWYGIGSAFNAYPEVLGRRLQQRLSGCLADAVPRAEEVALLGAQLARSEGLVSVELAAPLYVRDKVAFTTAERLARGGKA